MRFRINSDDFFSREEENGALSLIVNSTNQILFLNRSGRKLLSRCDEWVDLDEFIKELNTSVDPQKVRDDYTALLYDLNVASLAALANLDQSRLTGPRLAKLGDYIAISEFISHNLDSAFSCAITTDKRFYSPVAIHTRLKNGNGHYVLYETEGFIRAVLSASNPGLAIGRSVIELESAVFDHEIPESECIHTVIETVETMARLFRDPCSKIRYIYMNPRQDWIRNILTGMGFAQTAVFKKEIKGKQDVVFFDRFI